MPFVRKQNIFETKTQTNSLEQIGTFNELKEGQTFPHLQNKGKVTKTHLDIEADRGLIIKTNHLETELLMVLLLNEGFTFCKTIAHLHFARLYGKAIIL
jgi:hypothetical protein